MISHTADSNDSEIIGSPSQDEPIFLEVGQLRRPHGVKGEIQMVVYTDFPERITPGRVVYLGDRYLPHTISTKRMQNEIMLLAFEGFPDRTAVEILRNQRVSVRAEEIPELPVGEFYQHQLLDLQVVRDNGIVLGVVAEILETGANDVLVVMDETGKEILLPLIDDVVLQIDLETRKMIVHLLPGLIPGEDQ